MNTKVLFIAFLCILSASIIFNAAMVMPNMPKGWVFTKFALEVHKGYLKTNRVEPNDPINPPDWP